MSQNSDTHSVCNERLHREGEKATCCNCNPHERCTLNKKSIVEWAKEDGLNILDPDGFDRSQPDVMTKPRTKEEYLAGIGLCTVIGLAKKECKHPNKIYQDHTTVQMTYPPKYLTWWICWDCGREGTRIEERNFASPTYANAKQKWGL